MLKKSLQTLGAAAALAAMVSLSTPALATDEKPALNISVVDIQLLLEKATAVTKIREQIDKKAEDFKKEFTKKEEYFKKKYEDLEKQKTVLSKEAFDKKSEDLQKELADAQKKVQENRTSLDKAHNEAMQKVEVAFTDIVKEEAKKNNVKMVIHKSQTVYAEDSLDMTSKVIEALNKKLPSVDVKF